jgi:hypothetical protein
MKVREYCEDEWLPVEDEILLMSAAMPSDIFPARLEPRWFYEGGSRSGQRLAGAQIVPLEQWDKILSCDAGIGGHLLNPKTREFYLKFKEDILNHIIPELVRPDPEDSPTLTKLVNYMKTKPAPNEAVFLTEDLATFRIRQLAEFQKPYSGKYRKRKPASCNEPYRPEIGDFVVVKVEAYEYNPRGVPELGTVLSVSECQTKIMVNWWWTMQKNYFINDSFDRIRKNGKNWSSEVDIEAIVLYGLSLNNGTKKGTKQYNKVTLDDLRQYMADNSIVLEASEQPATYVEEIESSAAESEPDSDDEVLIS